MELEPTRNIYICSGEDCTVQILDFEMTVNLRVLEFLEFDTLLGMK
jgi:hypothetical protein